MQKIIEYEIQEWYLPALINNDFTGLEASEASEVREFIERVRKDAKEYGFKSWHIAPTHETNEFGLDWRGERGKTTKISVIAIGV